MLGIRLLFAFLLCRFVGCFRLKSIQPRWRPTLTGLAETAANKNAAAAAASVAMPLTWDEMIRQAASAMNLATESGVSRQIVRVMLPRDATNADFGKFFEGESNTENDSPTAAAAASVNTVLCPTDESWQGGIMQLYRSAAPTATSLLRQVLSRRRTTNTGGLVPRITEDRSVDESGVDGVGLLSTSDNSIQCYVQPTQEIIGDVLAQSSNTPLVVFLNPQWRQVDDALDTASQGEGFLSGLASMLGGKGGTLKQIREAGFVPVYTLEGYVCRGSNVRLLQVYQPSQGSSASSAPWSVFCERDDGESFVFVGTSELRPTYQEVERMLNDADIGFKYARDMGMQPKL